MFHSVVTADLPSVEQPGAAPGDDAFAPVHDRLNLGPAAVVRALQTTFLNASFTDVALMRVDGVTVYEDKEAKDDDEMAAFLHHASQKGFLATTFDSLELYLCGEEGRFRHVAHVVVRSAVPAGEPELNVRITSVPRDLELEQGEAADAYVERLRRFVSRTQAIEAARQGAAELSERIADGLRTAFDGADVALEPPLFVVVRPASDELLQVNHLRFGRSAQAVSYAIASEGRFPFWHEPIVRVFHDPYLVARQVFLLDFIVGEGLLGLPWVRIVSPDGAELLNGSRAEWFQDWPWRKRFRLIVSEGSISLKLL